MLIKRDLIITGTAENLAVFLVKVLNFTHSDWKIYKNIDEEFEELILEYVGLNLPKAKVRLIVKSFESCWNGYCVTPYDISYELSTNEWNALTMRANKEVLNVCAKDLVDITTTKANITLEDEIGKKAANAFRKFSLSTNKMSGYENGHDMPRWFEFICCLASSRKDWNIGNLQHLMVDDFGWNENIAEQLSHDCYIGVELLKYKKHRF